MAKAPRINGIVGPFTFAHPHLTAPDTEGTYADNKYKTDGVDDPNSASMKAAKKLIGDTARQFGLDPKTAELPIKEQTEKDESGKRVKTGKLLIRAKSQYAPAIVDSSGKPIPAKTLAKMKIGAGSQGLMEGYFSPYKRTETVKQADGTKTQEETPGMSFTLTGIQLIKLVQGGAGNGGATFGAYAGGGFTLDEAMGGDDADDDGLNIGGDADDSSGADDGGLDI